MPNLESLYMSVFNHLIPSKYSLTYDIVIFIILLECDTQSQIFCMMAKKGKKVSTSALGLKINFNCHTFVILEQKLEQ